MCNSGMWMQQYLACRRVRIHGITVNNHSTYNNDGLDLDGCRDAVVSDCRIDSDDDGICLKSTSELPCEDVKDLVLDGIEVHPAAGAAAAVRLIRSPGAVVRNSGDIPVETHDANEGTPAK